MVFKWAVTALASGISKVSTSTGLVLSAVSISNFSLHKNSQFLFGMVFLLDCFHFLLCHPILDSFTITLHIPDNRHCLSLGLCRGTVSGQWKTVTIFIGQIFCILYFMSPWCIEIYWPIYIYRPTNYQRMMPTMSHTPLTVLQPPGQDCLTV